MQKVIGLLSLTAVCLWLAGCANAAGTPTPPAATATRIGPPLTPTREVQPTNTPRPTPTPIVPGVSVSDQTVGEAGEVLIDRVALPDPGWVVVYAAVDGAPGGVLGETAVPFGVSQNVAVAVDPLLVTDTLFVMLHSDRGTIGTFEYPGADEPIESVTAVSFAVDIEVSRPGIEVADGQTVAVEAGTVTVDRVLAAAGSWLLLHNDDDGDLGDMVGMTYVEPGVNNDVVIPLRWREASNDLWAVLYEDNGRSRRLDVPGADSIVRVGNQQVMVSFRVALPLDVFVLEQPVINGTITVERAVSQGPGWLAVYYDDNDSLGLIIGFAPLADGVNEQVVVEVIETAVTERLFILLHEDTNPGDEFDLPANDAPFVVDGRIPDPYVFRTDAGNYIVAQDQALVERDGQTGVVLPLVVVTANVWTAVLSDADGTPDAILGQVALPPGIHHDVFVPIDTAGQTEQLYARLYANVGDEALFEVEELIDIPLQRSRRVIETPFFVLPTEN